MWDLIVSVPDRCLSFYSNNDIFRNRLRIRLSPLKSPILRKNTIPYKRSGIYPSISKCKAKSCICCKYLIAKR